MTATLALRLGLNLPYTEVQMDGFYAVLGIAEPQVQLRPNTVASVRAFESILDAGRHP